LIVINNNYDNDDKLEGITQMSSAIQHDIEPCMARSQLFLSKAIFSWCGVYSVHYW